MMARAQRTLRTKRRMWGSVMLVSGGEEPLPPTPSPQRRGGEEEALSGLLPLSASGRGFGGRGLGGGVVKPPLTPRQAPHNPHGILLLIQCAARKIASARPRRTSISIMHSVRTCASTQLVSTQGADLNRQQDRPRWSSSYQEGGTKRRWHFSGTVLQRRVDRDANSHGESGWVGRLQQDQGPLAAGGTDAGTGRGLPRVSRRGGPRPDASSHHHQ